VLNYERLWWIYKIFKEYRNESCDVIRSVASVTFTDLLFLFRHCLC
jgi:hypothetical protein